MRNRRGEMLFRPTAHGISSISANTCSLGLKIEYDIHGGLLYEVSQSKFGSGAIRHLVSGASRHPGHARGEIFLPLSGAHRYSTRRRTARTVVMHSSSASILPHFLYTQAAALLFSIILNIGSRGGAWAILSQKKLVSLQ